MRGVNNFCRLATTISAGERSANELAGDRSGARVIVAGRSLAVNEISPFSLLKKTRMAVGAVENGPPFSKARWARLRVHGAGSVHGLFGRGDRPREHVGVAKPVEPQVGRRDDRRS